MASDTEEWRPGSFTKNFSWGAQQGLRELYDVIRIGFDEKLEDVARDTFRSRVKQTGRPDYIPINFFLFNKVVDGEDRLLVDELVFQALSFDHSTRFDHLALFAFIFSTVGTWKGARPYQERPALWAKHYVSDRLAQQFNWNASRISADDIETFVQRDARYKAQGARKLSTNLNYLLKIGGIDAFSSQEVSRWWVDSVFLSLDRIIERRLIQGRQINENEFDTYLAASGFFQIAGRRSIEKDLASRHVVNLYRACGSRSRFDEEAVIERTSTLLEHVQSWANNPEPVAGIHPSNPKIVKTIPRPCAMLAQSVGFETFDIDALAELNFPEFIRQNLQKSLETLRNKGISPSISAEDLMKLMRGE